MRTIAATALLVTVVSAQGHPDFSGEWSLVRIQGTPAMATATTLKIESTGPPSRLTVTRTLPGQPRTETYDVGTISGGVGNSWRTTTFVHWSDSALLIETDMDGAGTAFTERWRLDGRGRFVVTVTEQHASGAPRTWTAVYRKH